MRKTARERLIESLRRHRKKMPDLGTSIVNCDPLNYLHIKMQCAEYSQQAARERRGSK